MAFRLKGSEPLDVGIKRIIRDELGNVDHQLGRVRGTNKKPCHEARKGLKKCRAALRLIRPDIAKSAFQRENKICRDVARLASEVRDAQVMIDTFDGLVDRRHSKIAAAALEPVRRTIRTRALDTIEKGLHRRTELRFARQSLRKCEERIARLHWDEEGWKGIEPGLHQLYRSARRKYRRAERSESDEHFHEWRKAVKYLRHSLELIEDSCPDALGETAKELHELGDFLGDDHDLTVLEAEIAKSPGDAKTVKTLSELIQKRKARLRRRAKVSAERLFAEKPGAFVRRIHNYWATWRKAAACPEKPATAP